MSEAVSEEVDVKPAFCHAILILGNFTLTGGLNQCQVEIVEEGIASKQMEVDILFKINTNKKCQTSMRMSLKRLKVRSKPSALGLGKTAGANKMKPR